MRQNKFTIGLFLFVLMIVPGMAQAHSADTFTVVIKQSGLTPSSSQIAYNSLLPAYLLHVRRAPMTDVHSVCKASAC